MLSNEVLEPVESLSDSIDVGTKADSDVAFEARGKMASPFTWIDIEEHAWNHDHLFL